MEIFSHASSEHVTSNNRNVIINYVIIFVGVKQKRQRYIDNSKKVSVKNQPSLEVN